MNKKKCNCCGATEENNWHCPKCCISNGVYDSEDPECISCDPECVKRCISTDKWKIYR